MTSFARSGIFCKGREERMENMKTVIAIPCMETVQTEFVRSLVNMRYVGEVQFIFTECSLVYQARTALCGMAMEAKADYVLWLDSDVVFQPDLMEKLMEDIQGKDMVTAVYHGRRAPFRPVIYKTITPGLLPMNISIDHANVEILRFESNAWQTSVRDGEQLAGKQLNEARTRIQEDISSNLQYYEFAEKSARSLLENLIRSVNSEIPDLKVEIEFF